MFAAITTRKGFSASATEQKLQISPNDSLGTIRPELHGHFAEHLGSCVYGGLWVGKKSSDPQCQRATGSRRWII